MGLPANGLMTLDAEIRVRTATVQLARFHVHDPADTLRQPLDSYWLDLCLTPRPSNARACYRDRWGPNRFERFGKLFLLPPQERVQARSDGGPSQTSVLCLLRPEPIREWFDGELQWTDQRLAAALDIPDDHIRRLLLRLAEELRHPGFASDALVELLVAQLAIELSRYCATVRERPGEGGLAPWRLKRIDERLHEIGEPPTLAELAGLCGLSVRQLTRGFRTSRGRSIGDHVASCRIDLARQLLTGEQSVKAIAYATQVGVDLLRYGAALPERPLHRGLIPWQLSRIDERLREVREAPTLQELAGLCRISVRQLTRAFRAVRGCSVGAHVASSQIAHAKGLLGAGESVAAIAMTLGFSSSSNFCSAFRRATGMTPGEYRQTLPRH